MEQSVSLRGRVMLITGGSSGIGAAVARASAQAGAKVIIAARGLERGEAVQRALQASGAEVEFVPADVARLEAIEQLVARTVERFGRLDYAFNNAAAASGILARAADFTEDEFDEVVTVNLKGVWRCMKLEVAQMLRQDPPGGAIVNMSSVNGLGGSPQGALYSATKAGVLALTKSAAQDYARDGIRVNALVAGAFDTPMLNSVFDRASAGDGEAREAVKQRYEGLVPMGRIGTPAEAAAAVIWLCSDAASYVTGHSMVVDGGMTAPYR